MGWTATVERTISAAHHNGPPGNKCKNNHGHDWGITVELSYYKLDEYGWGVDFGRIKEIIDCYDHGVGGDLNEKLYPEPPSSEVFARRLYKDIGRLTGKVLGFVKVTEGNGNTVVYRE